MYYPRFTKVIIHYFLTQDKTVSWRNKIRMHTSRDDYLINTLRFVSVKEATQIYGKLLPESLTSPEMKETKAYKSYLGFATGATPSKIARKFKKASPSKKDIKLSLVPVEEEPKSAKKKVSTKKTIRKQSIGVVLRDTPVETSSKGRKILRDFHKTHPSGYGTVTKTTPSAAKIKPSVTNEGTGVKPGVLDVTEEESTERSDQERDSGDDKALSDSERGSDSEHETDKNESGSESDQEENVEEDETDEEEKNDEFVRNLSNDTDDEDETKIKVKAGGDEDEGMDYTTNQFDDDVNVSLNEPVDTDEGFIQKEVFQFDNRVTALEKEVVELKRNDPLNTQVTALVDEHLDSRLGATRDEFMSYHSASITHAVLAKESSQPQSSYEAAASLIEFELKKILIDKMDKSKSYLAAPEHRECYDGLIKSYDLDKSLFSTYDKVYLLKRSRKDKDKDEDPSAGSDRGLKKRKITKDVAPTKGPKAKESQSGSSKGDKSQSKSFEKSVQSEEPEFEVVDSDMPQDQKENPGNDDEEPNGKVASKQDWFSKPKGPQEPTDPDWNGKKTPQQGPTQSWLMTLASSADKPSKTFDELMSTPIDFSAYIMNGLKISNLTQETLLGPAFKLLKGTRSNYAELEYDFE
ncbi:hypothetical protein Tco_0321261 [Tanacetum coccineum]